MVSETALEIEDFVKNYPGVKALQGVSLSFAKGEIHGLIGENGAGKSTLIKSLAGVVKPDSGSVKRNGRPVSILSGKDAAGEGLCFIHQELNLIPYFNAVENIFLGHDYPKRRLTGTVDWKALKRQAEQIMMSLDAEIPLEKPVSYLTTVDKAMVAIARAFAVSGDIYFMDEPATALTDVEKEKLFKVIRNLKDQGKTVVYVTHNLDDIQRITDRVTVMRDGRAVDTWKTSEQDKDSLIAHMIGRDLPSMFPGGQGKTGEPILKVRNLSGGKLQDLNFDLLSGEILGIGGLVGSGRSELLHLLFGIDKPSGGQMTLRGNPFRPRSPGEAIRQGVNLVPEERRTQGLVLSRSIYENISLMSLSSLSKRGFLARSRIRNRSEKAGRAVKLKTRDYRSPVKVLSGGNQQKVVFAGAALTSPRVLMLDEPTKGVDVGARFEIYSVIRDLAAEGAAILLVSSDFNEILGLADRILFLKDGCQRGIRNNEGMGQEAYLNYCYGRNLS